MLKIAKTIVLSMALLFSMESFASVPDTIVDPHQQVETLPLHVRMWSEDIYFFAMDGVYQTITVFNEHGVMLEEWSIDWLSETQNTAWPSISYVGWPDGMYVIEMSGEGVCEKYIMIMDHGAIVTYANNPKRQQ